MVPRTVGNLRQQCVPAGLQRDGSRLIIARRGPRSVSTVDQFAIKPQSQRVIGTEQDAHVLLGGRVDSQLGITADLLGVMKEPPEVEAPVLSQDRRLPPERLG